MDLSGSLLDAAEALKQAIEERIDSGVPPPNAPSTIRRKGHGLTLRDTWTYRNSIEIRISDNVAEIGVFGPVFDGLGQRILDELEDELVDEILASL